MHFMIRTDAIVITFINENCILAQAKRPRYDMPEEKMVLKEKMKNAIKDFKNTKNINKKMRVDSL